MTPTEHSNAIETQWREEEAIAKRTHELVGVPHDALARRCAEMESFLNRCGRERDRLTTAIQQHRDGAERIYRPVFRLDEELWAVLDEAAR